MLFEAESGSRQHSMDANERPKVCAWYEMVENRLGR